MRGTPHPLPSPSPHLKKGQLFPKIRINGGCWALRNGSPRLNLDGVPGIQILDLTGANLAPIDDVRYNSSNWWSLRAVDDYILLDNFTSPACAGLPSPYGVSDRPGPTVFGRWNGMYLAYDPRLVLEENTVEKPLADGGTAAQDTNGQVRCSNARRTFINEDHCTLSTSATACSPSRVFSRTTIKLDPRTLKNITEADAKFRNRFTAIYAFVDIPLTNASYTVRGSGTKSYLNTPCSASASQPVAARFERMPSTIYCAQNPSQLQQQTQNVFAKYLKPEFDEPFNPTPRYKTIGRSTFTPCAGADQAKVDLFDLGYLIGEDGACWKHVHPLEGNIYGEVGNRGSSILACCSKPPSSLPLSLSIDMSKWNFGTVNISDWKTNNSDNVLSLLKLGTGQDANKWMFDRIHASISSYPLFPGHLEDVVEFTRLPSNFKTQPTIAGFGKTVSNAAGAGVVVCGSVGEVANVPLLGDGFQYGWDFFRDMNDVAYDLDKQRHTVWAYLSLYAPDQLRQRMAWALSQINVVGFSQLTNGYAEPVLQYYDIFVRHAFGSYRDIMKQVSFSTPMAAFLSSRDNKSLQYSLSQKIAAVPDENFAREVRSSCDELQIISQQ